MAREGTRAAALVPVFPSLTLPSHYSIVTGLRPARHGVVGNSMLDPRDGARFRASDPAARGQARWWGGEPVWVTAERAGLPTAPLSWPGAEAPIGGARPRHWETYDPARSGADRVRRVLELLDLPSADRPVFLTLYFSDVDSAGHRHGPDSREVAAAVRRVDRHVGRLLQGLAERDRLARVNLLVVSDHGMTETAPGRTIAIDELVDLRGVRSVVASTMANLFPRAEAVEDLLATLGRAHPSLDCRRREDLSQALGFTDHSRIGPIVCLAAEGWHLRRRTARGESADLRGAHGYDPRLRSMQGILLARGPAFRRGALAPPIDSVHLYPLMCELLGLEPAPNEGSLEAVRALLDRPPGLRSRAP